MATGVVLVNGVPGSGKTTLATPLSEALGATLLTKDALKQALASVTDHRLHGALGAIAMDTVWRLAARVDGLTVVDSWWFRPRDLRFARSGLQVAKAERVVEVWCDAPIEVARARYEHRVRDAAHNDRRDMSEEWSAWQTDGRPLAISTVVTVDTTTAVDVDGLAYRVLASIHR